MDFVEVGFVCGFGIGCLGCGGCGWCVVVGCWLCWCCCWGVGQWCGSLLVVWCGDEGQGDYVQCVGGQCLGEVVVFVVGVEVVVYQYCEYCDGGQDQLVVLVVVGVWEVVVDYDEQYWQGEVVVVLGVQQVFGWQYWIGFVVFFDGFYQCVLGWYDYFEYVVDYDGVDDCVDVQVGVVVVEYLGQVVGGGDQQDEQDQVEQGRGFVQC